MAQERIDIVVSERGSKVVQRNIADIGKEAKGSAGAVELLKKALATLGIALGLNQLREYADAYTELQNKLRNATSSSAELSIVTDRLFEIANKTRTEIGATATLYQRLAISGKDLGASQNQLLRLVEAVGLSLAVSGTSTAEAAGSMLQFAQAMGAGVVRAEEFNSVVEGNIRLAKAAAEGLHEMASSAEGVALLSKTMDKFSLSLLKSSGSVSTLRTLINDGKVSSQAFFQAILSQLPRLESEFSRTVPTIGQALTVLNNQFGKLVGETDSGAGITTSIARAILDFAESINTLAVAIKALQETGILQKAGSGANDLIQNTKREFGTIAKFFNGSVEAAKAFWESFTSGADMGDPAVMQKFFDAFKSGNAQDPIANALLDLQHRKAFEEDLARDSGAYDRMVANMDKPLGESKNLGAAQLAQLKSLRDAIDPVTKATDDYKESVKLLNLAQEDGVISSKDRARLLTLLANKTEEARDPLGKITRDLQREIGFMGLERDAREDAIQLYNIEEQLKDRGVILTDKQRASLEGLVKAYGQANRQTQLSDSLYEQITGPLRDYQRGLDALNELLAKGRITQEQFNRAIDDLRLNALRDKTDVFSGLERGLIGVKKEFTDLSTVTEDAVVNAFGSMEDALVEFVKTGKLSVADLANSILADLARIAIRASITGPLASALSSALLPALGPGAGAQAGVDASAFAAVAHGGGVVGVDPLLHRNVPASVFLDAPRYHGGGIAGDEVAAVLRRGEEVLTEDDPRHRRNGGGATRVEIIDMRGSDAPPLEVRRSRGSGGEDVTTVFIRAAVQDVNSGGELSKALQSSFGLSRRSRSR